MAFAGDDGLAFRELRDALELWPEWETLYHHWAVMLLHRGQRDSALAVLDGHVHTAPLSIHGWLYAAAGRRDRGQHMLDSLLALNKSRPVDPADIAAIEVGLGTPMQPWTGSSVHMPSAVRCCSSCSGLIRPSTPCGGIRVSRSCERKLDSSRSRMDPRTTGRTRD